MLIDTAGYTGDIFTRLVEEHRRILEMLEEARRSVDDPNRHIAEVARLARAIRVHDRAEDATLFRVLDGSRELGRHMPQDHQDHAAIESLLVRLDPHDDLHRLRDALIRHFGDEEQVVFPAARNVIDSPRAADLLHIYEQECEFLQSHPAA